MDGFVQCLAFQRRASDSIGAKADPKGLVSVALSRAVKKDQGSKVAQSPITSTLDEICEVLESTQDPSDRP